MWEKAKAVPAASGECNWSDSAGQRASEKAWNICWRCGTEEMS